MPRAYRADMTSGPVDDDGAPGWRRADQVRQRARARLRLLHTADPSSAVPEDASGDGAPADGGTERSGLSGGWVPEPVPQRGWATKLSSSGAWGALAEKWVPEPLRHARTNPQKSGALAIIAVAVMAAVATAVVMYWTRPQPIPVTVATAPAQGSQELADRPDLAAAVGTDIPPDTPPDDAAQLGDGQQSSQRSPSGAADTPLVISVTGLVGRPGLVTVPAGARVADAIAAAGGVEDDALLTGINLAARLADGMSIVISAPGESHISADTSGGAVALPSADGSVAGGLININTADGSTLQQLPGIGPVTAAAIVAYRTEHGAFKEVAQLQEVSGIGPATFARLADLVTT